jgi:tetratricopeptide (TPR) repeat protein
MISSTKLQVLEHFSAGRRYYKLQDFASAKKCFEAALGLDPNDGPTKIYIERCDQFIASPPPEDWDGVYIMKTK